MMKKAMFFVMTLVASALFIPNVFAAEATPEKYATAKGQEVVFANGVAITIEAREDSEEGATIKWDGGSFNVSANASIFGGGHNHADKIEATSITMNGGTVYSIFGGSLHNGKVGTTYVEINGGKVGNGTIGAGVQGGGYYNTYVSTSDCQTWGDAHIHGALNEVTQATANLSPVSVDDATIVINGGNLDNTMVYGGGGGFSNTTYATITINNFEGTIPYLVGGGSNGYTGDVEVTLNDGKVTNIYAVNRGGMNTATLIVNGGEVTNAYASTLTTNNQTPAITHAQLSILGGTVENVEAGKIAGDAASVYYVESAVTNIDTDSFQADSIMAFVNITFSALGESETVIVPAGTTFLAEDVEDLKAELTEILGGTGYTFDNFYANEELTEVYDMTKPFNADTTVYINLVKVPADNTINPDTADINIVSVIAILLFGIGGMVYTVNKRRFN